MLKEKPECPERRTRWAGDELYTMCDLVDKWCLLEGGLECEIYEEFLKEEEDG